MPINEKLLEILVCPEDKSSLHLADNAMIENINNKISKGELSNRAGKQVVEKIEGGLIREDGKYLYPIREDIPIMLIDEAIPLK